MPFRNRLRYTPATRGRSSTFLDSSLTIAARLITSALLRLSFLRFSSLYASQNRSFSTRMRSQKSATDMFQYISYEFGKNKLKSSSLLSFTSVEKRSLLISFKSVRLSISSCSATRPAKCSTVC